MGDDPVCFGVGADMIADVARPRQFGGGGTSKVDRLGADLVRLSLTRQGEKVVMEIGSGNSFQAPAAAEPALRYIIENRSFTLSFMPGMLSEGSKRVLVKRLLKEGVLELAPTEETCQTVARTM